MKIYYVIRNARGQWWQTSKGFHSDRSLDATRYDRRDEAEMVCAFCVPHHVTPIIEKHELTGETVKVEVLA